jgi:hypothetical protein
MRRSSGLPWKKFVPVSFVPILKSPLAFLNDVIDASLFVRFPFLYVLAPALAFIVTQRCDQVLREIDEPKVKRTAPSLV